MKWILTYLRQHLASILLFAATCGIFTIAIWLYGLPVQAIAYPVILSIAFWLGVGAWRMYQSYQKHRNLVEIERLSAPLMDNVFPEPVTQEDMDYQQIISHLRQEQAQLRSDMSRHYEDMVDYYTTWAHQIKTPIASMRLTLEGEDSPTARRLSAELFRVEQYVEMVMTFLRLDSNSTDYVIRTCDLDGILREALRKFAGEFIVRKLKLNYRPLGVTVLTDEKWLSFVIEQVLSNALKYTPSGSISITMEPEMVLCIRDTGIGIAPEDLPRIFDQGYTGYNGRSSKQASGIGLYLCKRICTNLGHRITVESVPDVGTTIRIDLFRGPLEVE